MNLFLIIYKGVRKYIKHPENSFFLTVTSFFILLVTIYSEAKVLYNYDRIILYLCAVILFILVLTLVVSYKMGCRKVVRIVNLMRKYKNQLSVAFVIIAYFSPFSAILLAMLLRH